jgi:hypothetical protein
MSDQFLTREGMVTLDIVTRILRPLSPGEVGDSSFVPIAHRERKRYYKLNPGRHASSCALMRR